MNLRHIRRAHREGEASGFTLLEIIVCLAVMAIILVPLFAAVYQALTLTGRSTNKTSASADTQLIQSYWTKDVHNVVANGISYDSGCGSSAVTGYDPGTPIVTFKWDTATSTGTTNASGDITVEPKAATWVVVGEGVDARLVRRYCVSDAPAIDGEKVVADSFGIQGKSVSSMVTVTCTTDDCTIKINGAYKYELTVDRRVPGLVPANSLRPSPPVLTGVIEGNQSLTALWDMALVPDGGPPVDAYRMKVYLQGGSFIDPAVDVEGSLLAAEKTGLNNASSYCIILQAHNDNGWSIDSPLYCTYSPNPVPPSEPTNVTATWSTTPSAIVVSWSDPLNSGGDANYSWTIRARDEQSGEVVAIQPVSGASTHSATVPGLTNGIPLLFTVSATNGTGEGPESEPADPIPPCGIPDAPAAPTPAKVLTSDNLNFTGQVDLNWDQPAGDGGCKIVQYRAYQYRVSTGVTSVLRSATDPASPAAPTGLSAYAPADGPAVSTFRSADIGFDPGTYRFKIVTINEAGHESAQSPLSADVTFETRPTAKPGTIDWVPKWFSSTVGQPDKVGGDLSWTPVPDVPVNNGGFSIFRYEWTVKNLRTGVIKKSYTEGANGSFAALGFEETDFIQTYTDAGGEHYETYTVSIAAVNLNGAGPATEMTPVYFGGKPIKSVSDLTVTAAALTPNPVVRLTWTPLTPTERDDPKVNGSRPITGYTFDWGGSGSPFVNGTGAQDSTVVLGGITAGQSYTFKVRTQNDKGASIPEAPGAVVTARAPSALVAPPSSALTLSRPANSIGGRLVLNIGQDFTDNPTVPARAFSASCTASGGTTVNQSGLVLGNNTIDGFTNGKAYSCTVTATVTYPGFSGVSSHTNTASQTTSGTATPFALPSAPGTPTVTLVNGAAKVTWTAPSNDGGRAIDGYRITANQAIPGWTQPATVSGSTLTYTTPVPVVLGQTYTFTVEARNSSDGYGAGANSAPFTVTQTVPMAPTITDWTPVNPGQVTVTWNPTPNTSPQNGGANITHQVAVLTSAGNVVAPITSPNLAVGAGTYTFTAPQQASGAIVNYTATIYSVNANGNGNPATVSVKSGGTPLAAVTNITAAGWAPNGSLWVGWDALSSGQLNDPKISGGSPIQAYRVYWRVAGSATAWSSTWTNSGSAAIGGLTTGTNYEFRVYLTNIGGSSGNSVTEAGNSLLYATITWMGSGPPIIPGGYTQQLRPHSNTSAYGHLELTFSAFTVNAGSPPISSYTATCTSGASTIGPVTVTPGVWNDIDTALSSRSWTCAVTAKNNFTAGPPYSGAVGSTTAPNMTAFSR